MPVALTIIKLATFYHIDIPGIIVWIIVNACNTSYVLPRVYDEVLVLPYRYTWDIKNKLVISFFIKFNPYFWQICE